MLVHVYVYIYICTLTYVYGRLTYIYIHLCIYLYIYMHTNTCTYISIRICVCIYQPRGNSQTWTHLAFSWERTEVQRGRLFTSWLLAGNVRQYLYLLCMYICSSSIYTCTYMNVYICKCFAHSAGPS